MLLVQGVAEVLAWEYIGAGLKEALPEVGAAGPVDVGEAAHGWAFMCDRGGLIRCGGWVIEVSEKV